MIVNNYSIQVKSKKKYLDFRIQNNSKGKVPIQYKSLVKNPTPAKASWCDSCVNSECSMHQLSPYIGKLKSTIARDLIESFSKPGHLIIDPFSGAGTIPLEAALLGRQVFSADISPYSKVLTKAKLSPPPTVDAALSTAKYLLVLSEKQPAPDLRCIPNWVRNFFHPKTLKQAINFVSICKKVNNNFLLSCFLGILHHQRPGFLSYPSSHLVPYLRDKKFPKSEYPTMYDYRELRSRLLAKIKRAYKRFTYFSEDLQGDFYHSSVQSLSFPEKFDCLITSPPYMNTLDYGRDNRLRLWFIDSKEIKSIDIPASHERKAFQSAIKSMAVKTERHLNKKGYCIIVVGEKISRKNIVPLSEITCRIISENAPSLRLNSIIKDYIPDIRRSRKDYRGTKAEHILVFQRG